jgi:chromosome segregation ATPase
LQLEYKEKLMSERDELSKEILSLQNEKTLVEKDILHLTEKLFRLDERTHRYQSSREAYEAAITEYLAARDVISNHDNPGERNCTATTR